MVQQLPKTEKIQSMHQWLILIRMDHGLWPTQGAYLFNCYASILSEIVPDSLTLNGFIDDHSIRRTFKPGTTNMNKVNKTPPENNTIAIMEKFMHDIKAWVKAVKPKLNEAKSKFIYFGSRQQLNKATFTTIKCHRRINQKINKSLILGRTPWL